MRRKKSIKAALDSIICVSQRNFTQFRKRSPSLFLFGYPIFLYDSQTKRDYLCDQIGLPRCNGKA
jgi:hypothetical protein